MKVNIGIYDQITGNRVAVTYGVKLNKFRKLMEQQGWQGTLGRLPLRWTRGNYRAVTYFGVEPCLLDPHKLGMFSGDQYD